MSIIIDSDILIYFLKGHYEIVSRLSSFPLEAIFTTRINYTELLYGAYNSAQIENNLRKITAFLNTLSILEFDQKAGTIFAQEKARLKQQGILIADIGLIIASITMELHCTKRYRNKTYPQFLINTRWSLLS